MHPGKINTTVEQQITTTVKEAMEQYSPTKGAGEEYANAVGELTTTLAGLKHDLASLKNQFKQFKDRANNAPTSNTNKENSNPNRSTYTWENGLQFDAGWGPRKKTWYNRTLKDKEPERWKQERKVWLQKALQDCE